MHYGIGLLATAMHDYIRNQNKKYDKILVTRFDMLQHIHSLGECLQETHGSAIHLCRTFPYTNNTHVERIAYS